MPIIEVKNINFKYDKFDKTSKNIINDVSFSVNEKEVVALVGESGSGKSTLISHLNGLLKADSGDILYRGKSIYAEDFNITNLRYKCGIVFQYPEYQLFAETVLEDVAFGAIKKGLSKESAIAKSLEVLKSFDILYLKDETPFNLSGGEKRKVAFAGVFVMEPEVIIFDEPDAGLDSSSKKNFYEFIKFLNKKYGTTIIFITHNLDDVIEYADRVLVLKNGHLEKSGVPYEILANNELMEKCHLDKPYSVGICDKVKSLGYKIDDTKLKFDEMVDSLEKIYD